MIDVKVRMRRMVKIENGWRRQERERTLMGTENAVSIIVGGGSE